MQYSIGRDHKVNLGGGTYESIGVSAHWVVHHRDLGYSDAEWLAHIKEVGPDNAAVELIEVARALTESELIDAMLEHEPYIVEPDKSFVPLWLEDHAPPPVKKRGS